MFKWAPVISEVATAGSSAAESAKVTWDAKKEFAGAAPPSLDPLNAWEQLAQVLLLANEFSFID